MRSHVLLEDSLLDDIFDNVSVRLKYTCFAVSIRFIALGANTGFVNIFNRKTHKQVQAVLPEKNVGGVTAIEFAEDDRYIGYATSDGSVFVVDLNTSHVSKPERICLSQEHNGRPVTCLCWDSESYKLYSGDDSGRIVVTAVSQHKAMDLFFQQTSSILKLDSCVVQMDYAQDRLLVSTLTRSYLCHPSRQYTQIGKKLRDGKFGNCFLHTKSSPYPLIYCARPGTRIWEVDFEGTVLSTRQLKDQLSEVPFPLISTRGHSDLKLPDPSARLPPHTMTFPIVRVVGQELVYSWNNRGLYVINPQTGEVIVWSDELKGATDVKCVKNDLYVFYENERKLRWICLVSIEECLSLLIDSENWKSACVVARYFDNILSGQTFVTVDKWESLMRIVSSDISLCSYKDKLEELYTVLKERNIRTERPRSVMKLHDLGSKDHKIVVVKGGSDYSNSYEMTTLTTQINDNDSFIPRVSDTILTNGVNESSLSQNNHVSLLRTTNDSLNTRPSPERHSYIPTVNQQLPISVSERSSPVHSKPKSQQTSSALDGHEPIMVASVDDMMVMSPGSFEQLSLSTFLDTFSMSKQKSDPIAQSDQSLQGNRLSKFLQTIAGKALYGSHESLVSEASSDMTSDSNMDRHTLHSDDALSDFIDHQSGATFDTESATLMAFSWDYEAMMSLTQSVYRLIRDYNVMFDKTAVVDSLTRWLGHLHAAANEFCEKITSEVKCCCEQTCPLYITNSEMHNDGISYSSSTKHLLQDDEIITVKDSLAGESITEPVPVTNSSEYVRDNYLVPIDAMDLLSVLSCDEKSGEKCYCYCVVHGVKVSDYFSDTPTAHFRVPLPLPKLLHKLVCDFLNMCFRLRIHADLVQTLQSGVIVKHSRSHYVRAVHLDASCPSTWSDIDLIVSSDPEEDSVAQIRVDDTIKQCTECHGTTDGTSCSHATNVSDDAQMSFMLWFYFHWLSIDAIQESILFWNCDAFLTWKSFIKSLQGVIDDAIQPADMASHSVPQNCKDLVDIAKEFAVAPGDAIDRCIEAGCQLHPLHILYLCRLQGHQTRDWLVYYVSQMPSAVSAQHNWLDNTEVLLTLVDGILSSAAVESSGSIKELDVTSPEQRRIMEEIFNHVREGKQPLRPVLHICQKYQYIPGCIQLLMISGDRATLHRMLLEAGDFSTLQLPHIVPRTMDEWEELIQHKISLESTARDHSDCQSDFTLNIAPNMTNDKSWDTFLQLFIRSVGGEEATKILVSCAPPSPLPMSLYHNLLASSVIRNKQRTIIHNMLDKVNTYMWTKKPAQSCFKFLENASDSGLIRYGVEQPDAHWGVSTNLSSECPVCGLKLYRVVSMATSVLVCHCGKAYHKVCLDQLGGCLFCT